MKTLLLILLCACATLRATAQADYSTLLFLAPAASATWTPASDSSLEEWHKADALSLSDNDPVVTWADSSGNGRELGQSTSGRRPIYKASVWNSKPLVRFDGTDDILTNTFAANISQGFVIFIVVKSTVADTYVFDGTSGNRTAFLFNTASPEPRIFGAAGTFIEGATGIMGLTNTWTLVYNGASSAIYSNEVSVATGNAGADAMAGLALGDYFDGRTAAVIPLNGDVAEIAITTDTTSPTRSSYWSYLKAKYAHYP